MDGYLKYNASGSTHGRFVQQSITSIRTGKRSLADLLLTFSQMITSTGGDGSQDAHYAVIAASIGTQDAVINGVTVTANQIARGISDELNSLNGKIATDASVDHVNAAIEQACAKLLI
jgi:hypothetical protein